MNLLKKEKMMSNEIPEIRPVLGDELNMDDPERKYQMTEYWDEDEKYNKQFDVIFSQRFGDKPKYADEEDFLDEQYFVVQQY